MKRFQRVAKSYYPPLYLGMYIVSVRRMTTTTTMYIVLLTRAASRGGVTVAYILDKEIHNNMYIEYARTAYYNIWNVKMGYI